MNRFAVWTLGVDRPGIVAGVTGALFERGCNLADCSMTILAGNFAMVLIVDADESQSDRALGAAAIEEALSAVAVELDLVVSVRALHVESIAQSGLPYVVSVYGADRPGIVHRVARAMAEADVNITDLETRSIGEATEPIYAMLLEVSIPSHVDPDGIARELSALADELGIRATMHPADADIF